MRSDDCGSPLVAFLEEFEQVEAFLVSEPVGAPIVENEKLDAGQLVDQLWEPPIEAAIAISSKSRGMRA